MLFSHTFRTTLTLTLFACLTFLLAGCATSAPEKEAVAQQTVWPLPPAQPRIRYLGSLHSLENLADKKQTSIRDILMGKEEVKNRELVKPYGVYADTHGRVFVADTGVAGLSVFNVDSGAVSFWGAQGRGSLLKPVGVAGEILGPVYVSDAVGKRIVKFDVNGKYLTAFGGEEELPGPAGLAFNEKNQRLYAVDTKRHQILIYTPEGVLESAIGEPGDGEGQFNFPTNIAIDRNGRLYVADTMNFRVQVLEADGTFIRAFGSIGDRPGNFNRLKGVGVDSDGHIYGVDASYNNFQIFNQEGQLMIYVGGTGRGPGNFYLPAGAYVDGNDRIYIADQYNQRVQMFQYLSDKAQENVQNDDQMMTGQNGTTD